MKDILELRDEAQRLDLRNRVIEVNFDVINEDDPIASLRRKLVDHQGENIGDYQ